MLRKLLNNLTPNYNSLKSRTVFGIIFLVSLFIRFPFFFRDYIDKDESTFIIMGQSWVNGHLPYVELWDLKPPINFLFFAGVIYAFGKSLIAIRFFGALIIAITSFYSYKITLLVSTKKIAFWCAIFCVFFESLFGSMQGVMSEHISMVFFIPAIYFLLKYEKWYLILIAGILMGLTSMVKLNMAYPITWAGFYFIYNYTRRKEYTKGIINTIAFGSGILLIIALTIFPYYYNGNVDLWWNSVIKAPLTYIESRRSSFLSFAPLIMLLTVFFVFAKKKNLIDFKNQTIQVLLIITIGIVVSFIKGGRLNGHYLIQLYPVLLILVSIFISNISFLKRLTYKPILAILLLLIPMESYLEYIAIIKNKNEKGSYFNGEGIEIPLYLEKNNIDTTSILFTEYHIGYWFLETNPPTKSATHPSNIYRSELFPFYKNPRITVLEEIRFILEEKRPQIIVKRKGKELLDRKLVDENKYANNYLEHHYKLLKTIGNAIIYQRLK